MAKALLKALKTDMMADLDMAALAQILRSRGRGNDTILAHITPKEAALLKKRGGRGSINPETGLPEYDDGVDSAPVEQAPAEAPAPVETAPAPAAEAPSAPQQDVGVLPGELGNIGTLGGQTVYPDTTRTTPTISSTPTGSELQALQAGGPQAPEEAAKPSFTDKALQQLTQPGTLAKLGLAGGLGAYGAYQSSQAQKQAAAATQQKQAIAAPYQQQGQQMIAQANAGQLTPANQQIIQAQRARLQQASVNMGGVGTQQIESQISSLTNQLLNNQYQYGLQVLQIGDNIAIGAINSQLQIDNQLAAANKSFYSSLANLVAGSPTYVQGMTPVTPPKA
jgi:hypothetical protein